MSSRNVVLPETLVAELIGHAAEVSLRLRDDFKQLGSERDAIRKSLIQRRQIRTAPRAKPFEAVFAIDGAHVAEVDRASAYSASCAVRVGRQQSENDQSSCLAVLPHLAGLSSVSGGLMTMQEIMLTVEALDSHSDSVCVTDGSRISTIIALNQFYQGLGEDGRDLLKMWMARLRSDPSSEPGRLVARFHSKDWLTRFLTSPQIVGNLKLVTTSNLVSEFAPKFVGRFDDKTLAALALEPGEVLGPVVMPTPEHPFHIRGGENGFPHAQAFEKLQSSLYRQPSGTNANEVCHLYYRPSERHDVFKVEINRALLGNVELLKGVLAWWAAQTPVVDIAEPYPLYIADRFAKQGVSISAAALKDIARRETYSEEWAWSFTQPYRTS